MRKGNMTMLTSVFVMALVAAGIGMGTMAYFSDVEMSTGNTFTAGTIDLIMGDPVPIEMEDLKPCETGYIVFYLYNDGHNPMHVWKHIFNVETFENGVIEPELEWYTASGINDKNEIDEVILYDMWIHKSGDLAVLDPDDILLVSEDEGLHIDDVECFYIYLGVLEPDGTEMIVVQSYHMEALTENWAQSDRMTFDVEFYAEQLGGPGPASELPDHGRP